MGRIEKSVGRRQEKHNTSMVGGCVQTQSYPFFFHLFLKYSASHHEAELIFDQPYYTGTSIQMLSQRYRLPFLQIFHRCRTCECGMQKHSVIGWVSPNYTGI